MKAANNIFEERLRRIEDTTGEHEALSQRFPLLEKVELVQRRGGLVVRSLSREGRGFLRRKKSNNRSSG
ncbi:MAG: hypothetical protein HKN30_06515 [Sulfitobacter sp.]|nr:hypothetical protein [Sulfitobacter sp.]